MTIIYIAVLIGSSIATFFFLQHYHYLNHKPTLKNVIKHLEQIQIKEKELERMSEGDVEAIIVKHLGKTFPDIQCQYSIELNKRSRQKIDIDIGKGQLGIEVKLAKTLKNINERNRLIGQVLFYQQIRYQKGNLLVLIVGLKSLENHIQILTLKDMISKEGNNFFYLKAV